MTSYSSFPYLIRHAQPSKQIIHLAYVCFSCTDYPSLASTIQLFLGVAEFRCFLLLCDVVWSLFSVFSLFCITSFGYCTRLQHQETTTVRLLACILTNLEDLFCQANKILVISSPDTKLPYSVKSHSGFYGKHRQRYCCESSANSRD